MEHDKNESVSISNARKVTESHKILGVSADKNKSDKSHFIYEYIDKLIPFSGKLLLAREFIWSMYVHMGFHPANKFEEVHKLEFDQGRLSHATDISELMEGERKTMRERPLSPVDTKDQKDIREWIESTFNLDDNFD